MASRFGFKALFYLLIFLRMCGELNISIDLPLYYGVTVDKLISHYVRVLKLKRPKKRCVAKK